MKMPVSLRPLVAALAAVVSVPCLLADTPSKSEDKNFPPLDGILLNPKLNDTSLETIYTAYKRDYSPEEKKAREKMLEERRKKLKAPDLKMSDDDRSGFQWNSSAKDTLRADPKSLRFLGQKLGEVLITGDPGGKIARATISIYNRGDEGDIDVNTLKSRYDKWSGLLGEKLGVRSTPREAKGTVPTIGKMWDKDGIVWLLEYSITKPKREEGGGERPEFIRLRIASKSAVTGPGQRASTRLSLRENVKNLDNGDIIIDGIPMVDQGQKGYCAVATVERIARYYKMDVDQHEIAQLANTSEDGTNMNSMEESFKKLGKLHLRATKLGEITFRQFQGDIRSYNKAAKREGKKTFENIRGESVVHPVRFFMEGDGELFARIKKEGPAYERFTNTIEASVKDGVPIAWALYLGMFKEPGLPQTSGGHMRIILGYNRKTDEIIYSDSWGKGHEKKRMPAVNAWCMTTAYYKLAPTR